MILYFSSTLCNSTPLAYYPGWICSESLLFPRYMYIYIYIHMCVYIHMYIYIYIYVFLLRICFVMSRGRRHGMVLRKTQVMDSAQVPRNIHVCDVTWCDVMWYDVMWRDVTWCDVTWRDVMWCDMMWGNVMWGEARRGEARYGMVKCHGRCDPRGRNVISSLVDGKSSHVPYRDSKLTRLLQDSYNHYNDYHIYHY